MSQDSKPAAASAFNALGPWRNMFLAVPRIQSSAAALMLRQQKELLDFLSHRCERDLEFVDRLGHVDDMSKLPELFSQFVQGASKDYADEARKCVDAGSRSASELAGELTDIQSDMQNIAA